MPPVCAAASRLLEESSPTVPTATEFARCATCHRVARALRQQRDTPSPLVLELRENHRRFQAAQNGGPHE